jgi:uncharacterized MAPEG superfamily protein
MSAIHALLGFAGWTLLLVIVVFLYRGVRFVGGTPINSWPRAEKQEKDMPLIRRMADAHSNCLENLPVFAVIVFVAAHLGRLDAINAIAPWVLYARVAQTMAHLSGTGQANVLVRASFWAVQLVLFVTMMVLTVRA